MAPRRKPRVYLDTSCVGRLIDDSGPALTAVRSLLAAIDDGLIVFVDSAWLDTELREARPTTTRDFLLKSIPHGQWVQWDSALRRDAVRWAIALGLDGDESGEADCRHLACALRGDADVLVTHDGRFYEAMRQNAKLLTPLRPARLLQWQEVVFEH